MASSTLAEVAAVQRRTVWVLLLAQVLGSIAVTAGIAMGGLILAAVTGSASVAGFSQASSTLGSALVAVPASRIALRHGRRVSLAATYVTAAVGAAVVVLGSVLAQPVLVIVGMLGFGAGQAASLQARFAGVDLATPATRGRTLSWLLFAVTAGGIVGPNLAAPTGRWAASVGLNEYAGPFFVSIALLALAALWVQWQLRPDPLKVAAQRSAKDNRLPERLTVRASIAVIWRRPAGRAGILTVAGAHAAMVGVMVMTPVHIDQEGHGIEVVGVIISGHVLGMYAFSPLMGWIADRYGARAAALLGAMVLLVACAVCASAGPDAMVLLGVGLFLLGLGWSACIVGGSVLVTSVTDEQHRPSVQGASDLVMGLAAASVAVLSGVIVEEGSYAALALVAALLVVPMLVALGLERRAATSARATEGET